MTIELTLHTVAEVPVEAEALTPDRLRGLSASAIAELSLLHGNRPTPVGEFFKVSANGADALRISGDLRRFKRIGADMSGGRIDIEGDVGAHLGAGMSGGEIRVDGDAGDWVAPDMCGGRIVITGDAGHLLGSAHRGSAVGIRGGEIIVHGSVGNEAGNGMRRGLIAVGGDGGDFAGVNMLAGSVFVLGQLGQRPGASMKRGSIVSLQPADVLPTFSYAGCYHPVYLRHYLRYLQRLGLAVEDDHIEGRYERYSGDSIELNRGEILLFKTR